MSFRKKAAAAAVLFAFLCCAAPVSAEGTVRTVNITVDTSKDRKPVSPYIYGTNAGLMNSDTLMRSVRAGGNRYTAYNWENNASNAGSDWKNSSDGYFPQRVSEEIRDKPGCVALELADVCARKDAYSLMTLQLAGYAAADMKGSVKEDEAAPSGRWNKIELVKGSDFTLTPDLNDGTVYMDEFVNYLVQTLGDSQNGGIRGYSLDNEPALWSGTHSLVHPEKVTCAEIIEKSVTMSKAVKAIDPGAEIFGPALFGYYAFLNFSDAPDWRDIRKGNKQYKWFIDYYLDEMKKAEDECGTRLLDVLDVHFYTEAKGACGERYCAHYDDPACVYNKLNATRSLWDDTYKEDSWITDTGAKFLPILPALKKSVDNFYPGTKIAVTEYDFQGSGDVTGAIMEADALGIFAQNEVYCANLFAGEAQYQLAAIDLYTNFDGSGNGFGDTLVSCVSDDIETSTAYASIYGSDTDTITLVVTNKAFDEKTAADIRLDSEYSNVRLYGINSTEAKVLDLADGGSAVKLNGDSITLEMEPRTVSLLVISKENPVSVQNEEAEITDTPEEAAANENSFPLPLMIGIAAAVIICAGVVLAVILRRKNRM